MTLLEEQRAEDARPGAGSVRLAGRLLSTAATRAVGTSLLLCLLALILAVIGLGHESLWLDEAYSVKVARLPSNEFFGLLLAREANMGPYYFLLRAWIALGDSEVIVRMPSVIAAVASVPLGVALARRLIGPRAGPVAATLLVVNAFFVEFAREARGYSLVMLLSMAATYLFVVAVEQRSVKAWVGYALVSSLAVYAHFFAGFVVLAHLLSLVSLDRTHRPSRKTTLVTYAGVLLLLSPLIVFILTTSNRLDWIPRFSAVWIGRGIAKLAGARSLPAAAVLLPLYAVLTWPLVSRAWRTWKEHRTSRGAWVDSLILSWAVLPVLCALAVSLVQPIFVDRYLIVALPGVALAGAAGFTATRPRRWAILLLTLVVSMTQVVALHVTRDKQDWRAATTHLLSRSEEGAGLVFYRPLGKVPWGYYVHRDGASDDRMLPEPVLPLFDWRIGDLTLPRTLDPDVLVPAITAYDSVWLVLAHAPNSHIPPIMAVFDHAFRLEERLTFSGITVMLYERVGP